MQLVTLAHNGKDPLSSGSDDHFGLDDIVVSRDDGLASVATLVPPNGILAFYSGLAPAPPQATASPTSAVFASPYTTVAVAANNATGHATFDLKFVKADTPTTAFMQGVEAAAQILANAITNMLTLNIVVDYGVGAPGTGGGAEGGPSSGSFFNYSTVRDDLVANGAPGDTNFNALPPANSTTGQLQATTQVVVWNAQEKSLGLLSATATGDDGAMTFGSSIDPTALVGVALHEITHAMGRVPYGPTPDIFDFTRFTSPGQYLFDGASTAPAAYFSVDGGTTNLVNYGVSSDPSDFLNQTANANDPLNEIYTPGQTVQGLTQLDLKLIDVLGFNTSAAVATPCYVTGTAIRTARGDVAVERLRVGDVAITASGERRPVVWIGRRALDLTRHPDPVSVMPVRVAAGAFGAGLPYRDLWLSPGHSLAFEGSLIPVCQLVNGRTVAQLARERVEYWHVELDRHELLLAEGLPAESFLDCGNRTGFVNGGAFVETHPDFRPKHWRETCLPLVLDGPAVVAAKQRLIAELAAQGAHVVAGDDAHLVVDGRRIDPMQRSDLRLEFALAPGARDIELRSRVFVPAHSVAQSRDSRTLGLSVGRLEIDGARLNPGSLEGTGWHEAEFDGECTHRWTDGGARLPAGAQTLIVELAGRGYYWSDVGEPAQAALFAA